MANHFLEQINVISITIKSYFWCTFPNSFGINYSINSIIRIKNIRYIYKTRPSTEYKSV